MDKSVMMSTEYLFLYNLYSVVNVPVIDCVQNSEIVYLSGTGFTHTHYYRDFV